jgi:sec-independent protein translocase protein TatC
MSAFHSEETKKLDFISHLEELRRRILVILGFFILVAILIFSRGNTFFLIVKRPIETLASELIFISPTEAFTAYLKIAFLVSFIITFPLILYQAWAFLHPAFPLKVKKRIAVWLAFALVLFSGGVAFSYFIAIPAALDFLINFGTGIASAKITLGKYISFFGALILVGGIVFEIPIVIGLLADVGILKADTLRRKRPHMLIAIMICAAVITPTQDIINMLMFAIPMILLFEIGIVIARLIEKRTS